MAISLKKVVENDRIDCGYGVTIVCKPRSDIEIRSVAAAARRMAESRLPDAAEAARDIQLAVTEDGAAPAEALLWGVDEIQALARSIAGDIMFKRWAVGWEGVVEEDGSDTEFSFSNWERIKNQAGQIAINFVEMLEIPAGLVLTEGNASAPSSNGKSAVARKPSAENASAESASPPAA